MVINQQYSSDLNRDGKDFDVITFGHVGVHLLVPATVACTGIKLVPARAICSMAGGKRWRENQKEILIVLVASLHSPTF